MEKKQMERKTYRLDNAANMIPATTTGMDTRIMRITCECEEEIDAAALQEASDRAALAFPQMNCCLRKGLFWYYLEEMETRITVKRETAPVMQNIYIPGRRNTLYRLLYYKNRIILEMFHVLADGTGAFRFMEYIVTEYLILKYHLEPETYRRKISGVADQEMDSFRQYYEKERVQKRNYIKELFSVRAYRLPNRRDRNMEQHLLEGAVAAGQMKKLAHSFGTTIGVLVTALWVGAFLKQMNRSDYRRPVVVSVPINLRSYFSSESTRNFFGVICEEFWRSHVL